MSSASSVTVAFKMTVVSVVDDAFGGECRVMFSAVDSFISNHHVSDSVDDEPSLTLPFQ